MRESDTHSSASARSDTPQLPPAAPLARLLAPADRVSAICETNRPVVLIGSRRDCDLPIGHSDISQVHCAVVNTGRSLVAVDLCSRNGTYINGERIGAQALRPGDVFRVGDIVVAIELLTPIAEYNAGLSSDDSAPPNLSIRRAGRSTPLTPPALIGRRSGCSLVIDTPDVSLAHALIFCLGGAPLVFDLGSRSGTLVNGARQMLVWLRDGDQVSIGGETLRVEWAQVGQTASAVRPVVGAAGEAAAPRAVRAVPQTGAVTPLAAAGGAGRAAAAALRMNGVGDMAELESILGGLHSQISALRSAADSREADLQQRETRQAEVEAAQAARADTLKQRETQISVRELALAGEQTALEQRSERLQQAEGQLAARISEIERHQSSLRAEQAVLEARNAELSAQERANQVAAEAQRNELDKIERERNALQGSVAALARERARLQRHADSLRRRATRHRQAWAGMRAQQESLANELASLAARQAEFAARESDLAAREAAFSQVSSQVTRFRELLDQTNRLLCESVGTPPAAPPGRTAEGDALAAPPAAGQSQATAGPPGGKATSGASERPTDPADELPAPLVRTPIFTVPARPPGARSGRGAGRTWS